MKAPPLPLSLAWEGEEAWTPPSSTKTKLNTRVMR